MRTTIKIDSATPAQVYNLTLAFQRTRSFGLPGQVTVEPTVTVGGIAMGWESPALYPDHAAALLAEFDRLEAAVPTVFADLPSGFHDSRAETVANTVGEVR